METPSPSPFDYSLITELFTSGVGIVIAVLGYFIMNWMKKLDSSLVESTQKFTSVEKELMKLNSLSERTSSDIHELKGQIGQSNDRIFNLSKEQSELDKRISLLEQRVINNQPQPPTSWPIT
jgi:peptidoglycan hydrolase CwlO-like protein